MGGVKGRDLQIPSQAKQMTSYTAPGVIEVIGSGTVEHQLSFSRVEMGASQLKHLGRLVLEPGNA